VMVIMMEHCEELSRLGRCAALQSERDYSSSSLCAVNPTPLVREM
jgi:hypothetical protein